MKITEEQLKEMLLKNKQFINYNGGNEISSIKEHFNRLNNKYTYLINNKIKVEYCENLGSKKRYFYLRITKINDK